METQIEGSTASDVTLHEVKVEPRSRLVIQSLPQGGNAKANYHQNRTFADGLMTTVKRCLGEVAFKESTQEEDRTQGFDMQLVWPKPPRIAVRVRTANARKFFDQDFTIRYQARNEPRSEWSKLVELSGQEPYLMVYVLVDELGSLEQFRVIDLSKVVQLVTEQKLKGQLKNNFDGTSFLTFAYSQFPADIVIGGGK
jgi:hypothetical protein